MDVKTDTCIKCSKDGCESDRNENLKKKLIIV